MPDFSIRDKCKVNTNRDADTFVGIMCKDGEISVNFPLGFHVSEDDRSLRKDMLLMLGAIESTIGHKQSEISEEAESVDQTGFPIQAYLYIIKDYFERGYYIEREVEYTVSKRGKINWPRTIKTQKPVIQDNDVYYLDFVTRRNAVNENQIITLIHELCVYDSFEKMGWLFTTAMPAKPRIKRNNRYFLAVLNDKLARTFNDKNKKLFKNMISVIKGMREDDKNISFQYGTYRFEYVWESLIDRVYGIEEKAEYFPKTTWKVNGRLHDNASLEPDSIMLKGDDIYVLDAKYYKYGATGWLADLPESTSINKQITYGEYVDMNKASSGNVYNAFIMPFDAADRHWNTPEIFAIGEATGNWRPNDRMYEHIQGILIDVKYLMQITVREDSNEIARLAECIEASVERSRSSQ